MGWAIRAESILQNVNTGSDARPTPIQLPGYFQAAKQPERETDHSPPSRFYTSTSPSYLHGVDWDNSTSSAA